MTEQEFIQRYVAPLGAMIEESVDKYNRTREETIGVCVARAKESWTVLQQQLGEQQEQEVGVQPPTWVQRCEIVNDTVYVGVPDEEGAGFRKVIFCPCGAFDGGVYVRFALFDERGDYKLMVKDNDAHHAMSYGSDACVCMVKDVVGVNFEELPEMHFRLPSGEEEVFYNQMLAKSGIVFASNHDGMWHDVRKIN